MSFVKVERYNVGWKQSYYVEKESLLQQLAETCLAIEHIGSTSIPGMWAKPLIDIAVAVKNLQDVDEGVIQKLEDIGYHYVPKSDFPARKFFRRGEYGAGTHHLHIYELHSEEWAEKLLFKEYLIQHKEAADEYIQLKLQLASKYERAEYTKLKDPFIQKIISLARREQDSIANHSNNDL